jgi:hypothetical protein
VGKAGAYPIGIPFDGRLLASPANIMLEWEYLPRTNTLAYFVYWQVTKKKGFLNTDPDLLFLIQKLFGCRVTLYIIFKD